MRFWVSWWGGAGSDRRPIAVPVLFLWWCSGEREAEPRFSLCALVDAQDEHEANMAVRSLWPEAEPRFCEPHPDGWKPDAGRFPPTEEEP